MMSNAMLIERDLLQVDKPRMGNRGTSVAPCDLFEVDDGWVLLQVAGQPMFKRWCRLVGRRGPVRRSPLRRRRPALGARRRAQRPHAGLVHRQDQGRGAGPARGGQAARRAAAPPPQDVLDDPHVEAMGYLPARALPGRVAAGADHGDALPAVGDAGDDPHRAPRCSASTPTRSSARSATAPSGSPTCEPARSSDRGGARGALAGRRRPHGARAPAERAAAAATTRC